MITPAAPRAEYPHGFAFAIQVARNGMVQALGLGMVVVVGLGLLPWPLVLIWAVMTVIAVTAVMAKPPSAVTVLMSA